MEAMWVWKQTSILDVKHFARGGKKLSLLSANPTGGFFPHSSTHIFSLANNCLLGLAFFFRPSSKVRVLKRGVGIGPLLETPCASFL
jgi:hypothetical protein